MYLYIQSRFAMISTKLFKNGNSQAVRIPTELARGALAMCRANLRPFEADFENYAGQVVEKWVNNH